MINAGREENSGNPKIREFMKSYHRPRGKK